MTHLLDTHVWIQRVAGETLPPLVEETLARYSGTLALSDISLWEVAKLMELERLEMPLTLAEFYESALTPELTILPISASIAAKSATLEAQGFHKDPADQIIVATALAHGLRLISNDTRIRQWGKVPLLWRSSRD